MSTRPGRRAVLATGLAAGVTAALSGCATGGTGSKGGPAPEVKKADDKQLKGTITVWSWDVAAKAMQRLAKDFQSKHPGTTVTVRDIGYDSAYDKITVGLKSGSGLPDVLTVEGPRMVTYMGNFPQGFYDLSKLAGPLEKDFDKASWKTVVNPQGKTVALPWDIGPCGMFYRRDYFRAAGIKAESILTWDDYVKAGEQLKKRTGRKMLILDSVEDSTFAMLLQQQGQHFYADGKVAVDSPEGVKAATLLKTLADKGLVDYQKGWDGLVTGTKEGKAATESTAAWWMGTLTAEMPELKGKFGVMPMPAFTSGGVRTSNRGGSVLAVPGQSKSPELAWAFVEFLLASVPNQVSMLKQEGLFPAYLPALADPYMSSPQEFFGGQAALKVFADLAPSTPPVEYTKDGAKATEIMYTAISGILTRGKDPKEALGSAAAQIASATGRQRIAG
ncbi:ABC transporter substrate-binding protein [Streptomyces spiroverticillatus]|uniref:ABC transporter substrate-binding protein n=1 Tax=Streptomyces finlayi TaxID=67296 RepID=A0A919CAV9_9ACTN|nr:sugar ABC transporter substrate-binding protein [Streptomyces finlayi]GHA15619.1 ABC transporter substrate-binding protein [Streptomyces spiroverticillatus]GHC96632.1 ABC transporter substrate-binding protein [Streptomyces finlayi]